MAKKRYGDGSVDKLPNGKHRGRVMVNGKRETVTCDTAAEVRWIMSDLRDGNGQPPSLDVPTLGEWLDEWLDEYSPDNTENTLGHYRWGLSHFDALRDVSLDDLTTRQVETPLRHAGLSRRSCVLALGYLAMAIDAYNTRERLSFNPAREANPPKSARGRRERRAMTPAQVAAFVDAAAGDPMESLFLCMVLCGLRPGEATGLRWDAVDMGAATLDVVQFRRVTRTADGVEVTYADPKAGSDRRMDLHPRVVAALRRRKREQTAQRLASTSWTDDGLIHTTGKGTPIDPSNLRRYVRNMADRAGVEMEGGTPLTPYELRHTAASMLVESGLPLEETADLLGHSVKVLIDSYRHRSKRRVSAHVPHIDAILEGSK